MVLNSSPFSLVDLYGGNPMQLVNPDNQPVGQRASGGVEPFSPFTPIALIGIILVLLAVRVAYDLAD